MKYRREIDGLRALAVVPVILFHAGFQQFSGGFVGVDVFFVISGYLITSIILTEMELGKFSLLNFYERRARRILPALFLVLFVCIPFAWFWLLPDDMQEFSRSLVAVCVFASNILFWNESNYFDTAADLKPLLHTWSLAVEEQYYVLFPPLLLLIWTLKRRWVQPLLICAVILSLMLAQWSSVAHPDAAFYLLPTRAWELLIGALAAIHLLNSKFGRMPDWMHELGSAIGIILILYSIFFFDESTPFPGIYATVPTVGAAMVILFSSPLNYAGRLLGNGLMVGVGLISYSAYLWHQPIFAFARHRSLFEPGQVLMIVLALLSLVLAYFSWKFVEAPFRDKARFSRMRIFTLAVAGSLLFGIAGASGDVTQGFRFRLEQRIENYDAFDSQFEASALRSECDSNYDGKGRGIQFCTLGNTYASPSIALFGDSHSDAINPVFDALGKRFNKSYVHIGLGGCPPFLETSVAKGNYRPGTCADLAQRQFDYVKKNNIAKVVLVGRWSMYTNGDYRGSMSRFFLTSPTHRAVSMENSRKVFEDGIEKTLAAYRDIGVEVFILFQVPQQKIDAKPFYTKLMNLRIDGSALKKSTEKASIPRSRHDALQAFNRRVIERVSVVYGAVVLNPDKYFCDDKLCSIGEGMRTYYRDDDHVSEAGALKMESLFLPLFEADHASNTGPIAKEVMVGAEENMNDP